MSPDQKQRGVVILALLLILSALALGVFFGVANSTAQNNQSQATTQQALALAKQALIGRAVMDNNRPGILPCPDTDNDGNSQFGNPCPANVYIGRLPWRTLGLPDLRDANGERLWYVLSPVIKDNISAEPINSDKVGTLNVTDVHTGAIVANEVMAIIFSPGKPIGDQIRDSAHENLIANYLELANASGGTSFISGSATPNFNDQIIFITRDDLFVPVERRILKEITTRLNDYYQANHFYPYASDSSGTSISNLLFGNIPLHTNCCGLPDWSSSFPSWFTNNRWNEVVYYSVAQPCQPGTDHCDGTGGLITVNVDPSNQAVVIAVGGSSSGICNSIANCLDAPNVAGGANYIKQPVQPNFNDQVVAIRN